MRIAQVAPLYESVPPKAYGGTERVVSYLTEELVRQGHDVTLFASGDSATKAKLVPVCPEALRLCNSCQDQMAHHFVLLEEVFKDVNRFDLVHFHIDYLHYPLSKRLEFCHVTTLHGRLDLPDLVPLYRRFRNIPVISISNSQRHPLPWINWQGTVYHGMPDDLFTFREDDGDYLAFLGRVSPEKGLPSAIQIAEGAGMQLKVAAKIDPSDEAYSHQKFEPLLKDSRRVDFIGEVGGKEKDDFLGHAHALLFPIDWPEPFGLVMIEAMACGTPVIAFDRGSVPEVMEDGVTGFVVHDVASAIAAVKRIPSLSRKKCRETFERRFTADRMARDYLAVYERIVNRNNEALAQTLEPAM